MLFDSNEYLNEGNVEKNVLGAILINSSLSCMRETILQPKHFLDEQNRKMFVLLRDFYKKYGNTNIQSLLTEYESNVSMQSLISSYFSYGASYCIEGKTYFKENEEKVIKKWQKVATQQLTEQLVREEIDYKAFKIKLDIVNQNQYFKNLLDMASDIDDTTESNTKEREYTGLNQLDYLTKGLEYGSLNVFSGLTNSGKTTFMTQVAKNFMLKQKKVFYFNGEQTGKEFKNNLYVSMCTKDQIEFVKDKNNPRIVDIMPKKEVLAILNETLRDTLYVYNNNIPRNDINTMLSVMEEADRKGVRIYFIDNFMQLDDSEQLDKQTKIVESFKRFARDKNAIVILVAHPRKLNFGTSRLNIFDISGTQNISNKATNIYTIIRKDTMTENDYTGMNKSLLDNDYLIDDCDAIIEVLKTKGNRNGVVGLKFDRELRLYREVRKLTEEEKARMDMESLKERRKRSI
jgi:replicative DNA helicase